MSLGKRFIKFCDENIVLIASGGLIIGIHWMWWKLQNNPVLVDPSEKKELPIILGAKYLGRKISEEYHHIAGDGTRPEEAPK